MSVKPEHMSRALERALKSEEALLRRVHELEEQLAQAQAGQCKAHAMTLDAMRKEKRALDAVEMERTARQVAEKRLDAIMVTATPN